MCRNSAVSPLFQMQPVTVHEVMSFLGKANFNNRGHIQFHDLCHVIHGDMLTIYHSQFFS